MTASSAALGSKSGPRHSTISAGARSALQNSKDMLSRVEDHGRFFGNFDGRRSVPPTPSRITTYILHMITGPLTAEFAGLVGEPARAIMLSALLDGRALTATELAYAARVTPQTASSHLGKLTEAGLLSPTKDGRHRYFRLASPKVAQMLDGIMAVALDNRPQYRPLSRQAQELSAARVCYDHLAGRLSVDLAHFFTERRYIVFGDEAAVVTEQGTRFLTEFGIDVFAAGAKRRHFCRSCLDWSERRPHIGGAIGAGARPPLLRPRLGRKDEAQPGCGCHCVGKVRVPRNFRL